MGVQPHFLPPFFCLDGRRSSATWPHICLIMLLHRSIFVIVDIYAGLPPLSGAEAVRSVSPDYHDQSHQKPSRTHISIPKFPSTAAGATRPQPVLRPAATVSYDAVTETLLPALFLAVFFGARRRCTAPVEGVRSRSLPGTRSMIGCSWASSPGICARLRLCRRREARMAGSSRRAREQLFRWSSSTAAARGRRSGRGQTCCGAAGRPNGDARPRLSLSVAGREKGEGVGEEWMAGYCLALYKKLRALKDNVFLSPPVSSPKSDRDNFERRSVADAAVHRPNTPPSRPFFLLHQPDRRPRAGRLLLPSVPSLELLQSHRWSVSVLHCSIPPLCPCYRCMLALCVWLINRSVFAFECAGEDGGFWRGQRRVTQALEQNILYKLSFCCNFVSRRQSWVAISSVDFLLCVGLSLMM